MYGYIQLRQPCLFVMSLFVISSAPEYAWADLSLCVCVCVCILTHPQPLGQNEGRLGVAWPVRCVSKLRVVGEHLVLRRRAPPAAGESRAAVACVCSVDRQDGEAAGAVESHEIGNRLLFSQLNRT